MTGLSRHRASIIIQPTLLDEVIIAAGVSGDERAAFWVLIVAGNVEGRFC